MRNVKFIGLCFLLTFLTMCTSIHTAVRDGDNVKVEELLSKGVDANLAEGTSERNRRGDSPLHIAVRNKNYEMVKLLIKFGADIEKKNKMGSTPLYIAIRETYDIEMVKLLVELKADVNVKYSEDHHYIHLAVSNSDCKLLEFLIKSGADQNVVTKDGQTLLHLAEDEKCLSLLLPSKNINAKNNKGLTPLDKALYDYKFNKIPVLIEHGALIPKTITSGGFAIIVGVDAEHGLSILHYILVNNYLNHDPSRLLGAILKKGFKVNEKDNLGRTPLHHLYLSVVRSGSFTKKDIEAGRFLISKGAKLNITDNFGDDPGMHAFKVINKMYPVESKSQKYYRTTNEMLQDTMETTKNFKKMRELKEIIDEFEKELLK